MIGELDLADVKPSVLSWFTVGLLAVTFILVLKWVATYDFVPTPIKTVALAI